MLMFLLAAVDWAKRGEKELIDALLQGDDGAFAWLVRRYQRSLQRVARGLVGSQAVAEEVVQETWIALIQGLAGFRRESSLKTWLFHVLINRARHTHRKEKRSISFTDLGPADGEAQGDMELVDRFHANGHWADKVHNWRILNPRDKAIQQQGMERLAQEIEKLPEAQRVVVTMRDVEGLDSKDVCELLDVSEANQRVLLHRGRTRLRQALEAFEKQELGED